MDIWGTLGIKKSAGIDEIRAAYSEKVKEFHPEDDPEGFMRVREAYKAAIRMKSGQPADFTAPARERQAQKPVQAEETPSPAAFDFSNLSGQEPGCAENKPPRPTFDFSGLRQEPERAESKPPEPAFDFSGLSGQEPERAESKPPEPAFDFSKLEQSATERIAQEEQFVDHFIAQAMKLYKSRKRVKEWRNLFTQPALDAVKHGEYFTWALLDFLAAAPEIPVKVCEQILDPFIAELRTYWQGTPLWIEFDVATQKYVSKGLKQASKTFLVQLACVALPILLFVVMLFIAVLIIPTDTSGARSLLSGWRASTLTGLICLAVASIVGVVVQAICFRTICKLVNRGVSGKTRMRRSRRVLTVVTAAAVLLCSVVILGIPEVSTYTDDIKQIDEGRLSEETVYVYSPVKIGDEVDTIHVVAVESGPDALHEDLYIPEGFRFNPDPSCLLNEDLSVPVNLANGMKAYRITYTDNHLVVVSITEVP